jgi:hypothetical protein
MRRAPFWQLGARAELAGGRVCLCAIGLALLGCSPSPEVNRPLQNTPLPAVEITQGRAAPPLAELQNESQKLAVQKPDSHPVKMQSKPALHTPRHAVPQVRVPTVRDVPAPSAQIPADPHYPVKPAKTPNPIVETPAPGPAPLQPQASSDSAPKWEPPCFHAPAHGIHISPGSGTASVEVGQVGQCLNLVVTPGPCEAWVSEQLPILLRQALWDPRFSGQRVQFQFQYNQVVTTEEFVVFILDQRVTNGETYVPPR